MENTLIFGLGSIGAIISVWLQTSQRTTLATVARSNFKQVKEQGVKVEGEQISGVVHFEDVYSASAPPSATPKKFSYIVVTTKALSELKPTLVESLEPYVTTASGADNGSVIVLIQNGVGIEDEIQKRWPKNLILTCVAYIGAAQTSPGIISAQGGKLLNVGPFHAPQSHSRSATDFAFEKERIDTFVAMVEVGGCQTRVIYDSTEMQIERWTKVAWNAAWNGLTALTDLDTDTYLTSSPSAEPTARNLMIEMSTVSRALGIEIDPHRYYKDTPEKLTEKQKTQNDGQTVDDMLVERVRKLGPMTSSMRSDVQNGKALESGIIFGYPLFHAKRLGISTPILETVGVLIAAIDARNAGRIKPLL